MSLGGDPRPIYYRMIEYRGLVLGPIGCFRMVRKQKRVVPSIFWASLSFDQAEACAVQVRRIEPGYEPSEPGGGPIQAETASRRRKITRANQ